jgi:MFS family permease
MLTKKEKAKAIVKILIVAFVLFFNSASTMYLYSFLPYMMVDFGMASSVTESGKYASWMASGYFFGRFLLATYWGKYIDVHGRKKGLIVILGSVSLLTIVFGFTTNYWMALIVRIFSGFFNGLSIVGKVLTTEVCPEELKSWSISIISTIWSLGMTCGPFIGSMFYEMIPGYPYLASALAVAILGFSLMILSYFFIDETLQAPKPDKLQQSSIEQENKEKSDSIDLSSSSSNASPEKDKSSIDHDDHDHEHENEHLDLSSPAEDEGTASLKQPKKKKRFSFSEGIEKQKEKIKEIKEIASIPNALSLIFIFSVNTFYAAVIGEMIPFWVAAKYEDGGLSFSNDDISQIFIYLSGPQLLMQMFLYPFLQKRKGDFWLLSRGHWAHLPMFFFLPFGHWFPQGWGGSMKFWVCLWMFVRNLASFMNFSSLQRYTNDTVSQKKRGMVNGYQIAFSSVLQSTGPFFGGYLLAWSMEPGHDYPFNYHFVFLIMVGITLYTLKLIYGLIFWDKDRKKLRGEGDISV